MFAVFAVFAVTGTNVPAKVWASVGNSTTPNARIVIVGVGVGVVVSAEPVLVVYAVDATSKR